MYIAIDVKYTFNDILICKINLYPPPPQKKIHLQVVQEIE